MTSRSARCVSALWMALLGSIGGVGGMSGIAGMSGLSTLAWLTVPSPSLALELNLATEAELDSLKGMGPALNRRVREARTERAFRDWSDLQQRVSGIGAHKAHTFSQQGLTVQGQSFAP